MPCCSTTPRDIACPAPLMLCARRVDEEGRAGERPRRVAMALAFDGSTPPARTGAAVNPATLRDEIHRLSSRLVRAREFYDQDQHSRDPEVPLDEQLAVIASYNARLESLTEQLRQHDSGELPPAQGPGQR